MIFIPDLPHNCNSWIVVDTRTNKPVFETTQRNILEKLTPNAVIYTAYDWLVRLNV